jgi:hypothetical protein
MLFLNFVIPPPPVPPSFLSLLPLFFPPISTTFFALFHYSPDTSFYISHIILFSCFSCPPLSLSVPYFSFPCLFPLSTYLSLFCPSLHFLFNSLSLSFLSCFSFSLHLLFSFSISPLFPQSPFPPFFSALVTLSPVEGLYCKRPIQYLASSGILTPHPLTARPRVCTPPPLGVGEDTLAGWRGGGGSIVRKTPDTALYSL